MNGCISELFTCIMMNITIVITIAERTTPPFSKTRTQRFCQESGIQWVRRANIINMNTYL